MDSLFERIVRRVRTVGLPSLLWAMVGSVAGMVWALPILAPMIQEYGYLLWLFRGIFSSFVSAFILILALCIGASNGTDMAQRPIRFLLALMIGAMCATAAIWGIDVGIGIKSPFSLAGRLMNSWLTILVFGGVFGWAAVLSMRYTEDQGRLAMLLGRRAILSRQLAQSRLLTARAQIDPELVVRVLNNVRIRYRSCPPDAVALLDRLIEFLRLAMNRTRAPQVTFATELALLRAYLILRQSETGTVIHLQNKHEVDGSQRHKLITIPLVLIAKCIMEEIPLKKSDQITFHLEVNNTHIVVDLYTGDTSISEDSMARVRHGLRALPGNGEELDILHYSSGFGGNRYVVHAATV
ncbi:MAG: hypothetical protein A3I66_03000 [Burkholderiales bacterium RIFCSPLOWO2_02_FULL_57_36]|nr:MAG: hypothetical protein A3I66_03000 [Burkholderiales bacterium RIFCSPLOWO2_02_FULL_57_36]